MKQMQLFDLNKKLEAVRLKYIIKFVLSYFLAIVGVPDILE
jgi:hypothetical protein